MSPEELIYHFGCQRQFQSPLLPALEGSPHLGCWFRTQRHSRRYRSPRCPEEPPLLFGIQRYFPKSGMKENPEHTAPTGMKAVQTPCGPPLLDRTGLSSVTLASNHAETQSEQFPGPFQWIPDEQSRAQQWTSAV